MNPIILNIDTAQEEAIISLSEGYKILDYFVSKEQKNHASVLHPAIREMLNTSSLQPGDLQAIAVTAGPGSYTGLRVGIGAGKGLGYALNIPVIPIGTLELMAMNAILAEGSRDFFYCPMIDARRMEIYTALYDNELNEIQSPHALIINESTFQNEIKTGKMIFFGSGSVKFKLIGENQQGKFVDLQVSPKTMAQLSSQKFDKSMYVSALDLTPLYIKDFFTINPTVKPHRLIDK